MFICENYNNIHCQRFGFINGIWITYFVSICVSVNSLQSVWGKVMLTISHFFSHTSSYTVLHTSSSTSVHSSLNLKKNVLALGNYFCVKLIFINNNTVLYTLNVYFDDINLLCVLGVPTLHIWIKFTFPFWHLSTFLVTLYRTNWFLKYNIRASNIN